MTRNAIKPKRNYDYSKGRRITIWVKGPELKMLMALENHSAFFQLALRSAIGIMTFDNLKKRAPQTYHDPVQWNDPKYQKETIETYNERNPLDPLTLKRRQYEGVEPRDPSRGEEPDTELW